ncbi:hypothetical protein ACVBEG_27350 [Pseudomonas sp. GG8]
MLLSSHCWRISSLMALVVADGHAEADLRNRSCINQDRNAAGTPLTEVEATMTLLDRGIHRGAAGAGPGTCARGLMSTVSGQRPPSTARAAAKCSMLADQAVSERSGHAAARKR